MANSKVVYLSLASAHAIGINLQVRVGMDKEDKVMQMQEDQNPGQGLSALGPRNISSTSNTSSTSAASDFLQMKKEEVMQMLADERAKWESEREAMNKHYMVLEMGWQEEKDRIALQYAKEMRELQEKDAEKDAELETFAADHEAAQEDYDDLQEMMDAKIEQMQIACDTLRQEKTAEIQKLRELLKIKDEQLRQHGLGTSEVLFLKDAEIKEKDEKISELESK